MAEGMKKFINQTDKNIDITLFLRSGDSPQDEGGTEVVSVAPHGQVEYVYEGEPSSDGLVFLNGLLIEWQEGSDMVGVSRKVVQRGDAWDNTLNTNNTVIIAELSAGTLDASGSNS